MVEGLSIDSAGVGTVVSNATGTLTFRFTPATGAMTGSYQATTASRPITFNGLWAQPAAGQAGLGAGYFLGTNRTGRVILEPAP